MNIYKVETKHVKLDLNGCYTVNAMDIDKAKEIFQKKYPELKIIKIQKLI